MNEHLANLQQLINVAVQKGIFSDSNSVIALQQSLNAIKEAINGANNNVSGGGDK